MIKTQAQEPEFVFVLESYGGLSVQRATTLEQVKAVFEGIVEMDMSGDYEESYQNMRTALNAPNRTAKQARVIVRTVLQMLAEDGGEAFETYGFVELK